VVKHPAKDGELPLCCVELESWFAKKLDLETLTI
jgi:hypothetical protein